MKDVEIEIQVKVSEKSGLQAFLKDNASFVGKSYQKDEYFTPAHRDFVSTKPIAEWLRLRESDKNAITYKNWHYDADGKSQYCDEYETPIDTIEQMRKIFAALDMKPIITVEKTRKAWKYKHYEIALDHVTGLGDFVEIEYKAAVEVDPKKATDDMIKLLKTAGCGKIERNYVGYPFMLLYPQEVKFETV
jgi:adenylate cyclase, class 2